MSKTETILIVLVIALGLTFGAYLITRPATSSPVSPVTSQSATFLTIIQSASTNTPAETFTIYQDGSLLVAVDSKTQPTTKKWPSGTIIIQPLQTILESVGSISAIQTGICVKSVSFGTTTVLTYRDQTSPDLQCSITSPASAQQLASQITNLTNRYTFNLLELK